MVGRPLVVALALALSLFAGCSEKEVPEETASFEALEEEAQNIDLVATATTGVIRGIVVDEAIRPIEGALVKLTNPPMEVLSNEAGVFGFEALEAGTYFMQISKDDYTSVQASTEVIAGVESPEPVRVQLQAIERATPSVELLSLRMHLSGSAWVQTPVGGTGVTCCYVDGIDRSWFFGFEFTGNGTTFVQVLTTWAPAQPAAQTALIGVSLLDDEGDGIADNGTNGASPSIINFGPADIGNYTGPTGIYGSIYAYSDVAPVGASVEQDYDIYAVAFYNFDPPFDYRFDRDGAPVPPS